MWSQIMKHKWQKVFIKLPAEILPEISLRYNSRSSTLLRDLHYSLTTLFTPTLTSLAYPEPYLQFWGYVALGTSLHS